MKFTLNREQLVGPLQLVSGAVERRPTLPILGNILLKVDGRRLWLTGTDLEVELISNILIDSPNVLVDGEITVPAKKFVDIVRSLPDGCDISFSLDANKLVLKAGRGRYSLSTLSAADYPNLEDWQGEVEFEMRSCDVKRLLDSTQFSMAQQDVRYYLNGMSLETDGNIVRTVATDGHRLALCKITLDDANLSSRQVIIPRKGVLEIGRLISDDDHLIKVQLGANHIRVFSNEYIFTSKLVDGRFPDYRRVLPKETNKLIVADKALMKEAFSRAAILSNEKFRGVRLNFLAGELKITANNPEQEEAEEIIDVDYQGEPLEIGFNVSYLLDVLSVVSCDKIQFSLSDSNSSALIEGFGDSDALYVIMPMRL